MSPELLLLDCGTLPYRDAWEVQLRLAERRAQGAIPDVLMLLQHPPVYSRGRRTKAEELPMGDEWYEARGIEVLDTDRGGLVTYHGPGQLVAYPIVDLAPLGGDVHAYVRGLERVMIGSLAEHGVGAQTIEGLTGVWTEGPPPGPGVDGAAKKIGSIGIHVSKGITTHGLAVNVDNDLQPFEWVVPCGIQGVAMTSIAQEGGSAATVAAYGATVARHFAAEFGREAKAVGLDDVGLDAAPATLGGER
ncbi:MAG TPA: lipoyl(octanoyl) transferase LipB [Solirubrobacterales bacterium]|jgi:lipoyl(octanoyl) transferase|nr:lipoyl(octanoyl) transferase LipB [Solirubrobacterales bacterium]